MTITVQQIQYTTDPVPWHALAEALGLQRLPGGDDVWTEFAGDGLLAVHRVDRPEDERTEVCFVTDDLDGFETRVRAAGATVRRVETNDIGRILVVEHAGFTCTATSTPSSGASVGGQLRVLPIWYGPDLSLPAAFLDAVPLRRRLVSDSGDWIDATADGGGAVALHRASEVRVELSFEHDGDLDALATALTAAGHTAVVVDEAYNRTLRVRRPDGPDLWVNGRHDDLYGYTRLS
ncbi:VOC family protein [Curtobacterium luteum]|uniref:VOC family protein n=1 Tax=Curtobacterium luteum TaxID=33881 RepID=UPI003825AF37